MRTRPDHRRLLAIAAGPLALAAMLAAPAATHAATTATTHTVSTARTSSTSMPFAGLTAKTYNLTLITGDTVTLTRAAPGRYSVTADQAPGSSQAVYFTSQRTRTGTTTLYAQPVAASALIAGGQVDRGMFDLSWLAAHGDTGQLPLVLRFGGHRDAAAMHSDAAALPGVTVTGGTGDTVSVSVAAGRAAAFWAALTGASPRHATGPAIPGRLADGITKVWLAGHQVPAIRPLATGRPTATGHPADQAGQPLYTLTLDVSKSNGDPFSAIGCGGQGLTVTTLCLSPPLLSGLAGSATDQAIGASGYTCLNENPCSQIRVTFQVPAGVYHAEAFGFFFLGGNAWWQNIDVVDPQVTVAGDTHISIDADAASQVSVRAPHPVDQDYTTVGHVWSTSDGQWYSSFLQSAYGAQNDWITTTNTEPVTIGDFHLMVNLTMQAPPVTMTVTASKRFAVRAIYPSYLDPLPGRQATSAGPPAAGSFTRFSGSRSYGLVDAGYGAPSDYAGLDAHGKLVLLHIANDDNPCQVPVAQLNQAIQAGAAGVLVDPSDPSQPSYGGVIHGATCVLPVWPQWWDTPDGKAPAIPYAAISKNDAAALRTQLSSGPVQVNVSDSGQPRYQYQLHFGPEGALPASETYRVGAGQLTDVTSNLHGTQPGWDDELVAAWAQDDWVTGGAEGLIPAPGSISEYYGPDSPDTLWEHLNSSTDSSNADSGALETLGMFDQRGGGVTEDLNEGPGAPGTMTGDWAGLVAAQPEKFHGVGAVQVCSYCRQGNLFEPFYSLVSGADPQATNGGSLFAAGSKAIHLYDKQGNEIPQFSDHGLATYQLPADPARYKFTQDEDGVSTAWDFTSSAPATDQTPPAYTCVDTFFGADTPCRADPLIFLRYNAFMGLANTVTAPGPQRLGVDAYYQAPDHPAITSLKLWISTDGGTTWQPVTLTGQGGSYLGKYTLPSAASTNGYVSLKAQATDAAGNDVTQVIDNAYAIAGR